MIGHVLYVWADTDVYQSGLRTLQRYTRSIHAKHGGSVSPESASLQANLTKALHSGSLDLPGGHCSIPFSRSALRKEGLGVQLVYWGYWYEHGNHSSSWQSVTSQSSRRLNIPAQPQSCLCFCTGYEQHAVCVQHEGSLQHHLPSKACRHLLLGAYAALGPTNPWANP